MSAQHIATLEARRLARSPGVWIAGLLFAATIVLGVSIPAVAMSDPDAAIGAAFLLGPGVELMLPLIVIVFTYGAVANHRARGSVHVFLQAPVDRRSVLGGILLGRICIVLALIGGGLVIAVGSIWFLYGPPPLRPVAAFVGITLVAGVVLTCIGVGVSACFRRPVRALAVLIGGFLLAHFLWELLVSGTYTAWTGTANGSWLIEVLTLVSPLEAYDTLADGVLPASPHLELSLDGGETATERGDIAGGKLGARTAIGALVSLIGWAVTCLVVGIRQFSTAEIW